MGVVARLEAEKGHRTLVDAWPDVLAAVPSAWLLVVGEGSERNALEAEAAALGVSERVVFTGRREDVPARDRGAGRRGPAVLSRGAGPQRARGDGAEPARRGDRTWAGSRR